jgi:cytochrome c-type biogenesis protein CcmH
MRTRAFLLASMIALAPVAVSAPAWAVDPEDQLSDPVLEARAREITKEVRCLVCAGQSVDDSSAPVAQALRKMVRERLVAGDSDEEVFDAVAARYGEYALLKPRFSAQNLLLWMGPFLVLILGGFGAVHFIRANRLVPIEPAPLSDDERAALEKIARDG